MGELGNSTPCVKSSQKVECESRGRSHAREAGEGRCVGEQIREALGMYQDLPRQSRQREQSGSPAEGDLVKSSASGLVASATSSF